MTTRNGIISAGNWIVDRVKTLDVWPDRGMLANIVEESQSTGGSPANVLVTLARLKARIPLYAAGLVGDDADGRFILNRLQALGIDTQAMRRTRKRPTACTDVMTESRTGTRTFFCRRGANALLDVGHFRGIPPRARIFHLGYLLLLDRLDAPDAVYGVRWGRLFHALSAQGYLISVDAVSAQNGRFKKVVGPILGQIDYLILNEIEASGISGIAIRDARQRLRFRKLCQAAQWLIRQGVRERVIIHFPEGGYVLSRKGHASFEPSFRVAPGEIRGTVGAGDAFCAGMLYGTHESWPLSESLRLANACAAFCLTDATSTGGAGTLACLTRYLKRAVQNELPVDFHRLEPGL